MLFNRPKPFTLTIDKPCEQPWEDMQTTGAGKFCAQCSKTVVDFTRMSDAALFDYVKKNGLGCGRLLDTQLNRMIAPPVVPKKKFWPQLLLSIGMFLGFVKESNGQPAFPGHEVVQTDTADKKAADTGAYSVVEGTVTDEKGNPLPGAQITITRAGIPIAGAATNFDGFYHVLLPVAKANEQKMLRIYVRWQNFQSEGTVALKRDKIVSDVRINTTSKLPKEGIVVIAGGIKQQTPLINYKEPTKRTKKIDK